MKTLLIIGAIIVLTFIVKWLDIIPKEELSVYQKQVLCENLYWQDRPEEMKKQGCDIQAISNEIYETIRGY